MSVSYWVSRWNSDYYSFEDALNVNNLIVKKRCTRHKPNIGDKVAIVITKRGGLAAIATVVSNVHEYDDKDDPNETDLGKQILEGRTKGIDLKLEKHTRPDDQVFGVDGMSRLGPWTWKKLTQTQYEEMIR